MMNHNALVSVIIPIYNVKDYVRTCLQSVTGQTYTNIEVIVINDGSTDGSENAVEEFLKVDNRIRMINQKNKGLSAARNEGVKNSRGDYVAFVDGDDFISIRFIEVMLHYMRKCDADIVCCESLSFVSEKEDATKRMINSTSIRDIHPLMMSNEDAIKGAFYQKPSITGAPLKLYKKQIVKAIPFPEGRAYEDLATTYKFLDIANKVVFLDQRLYAYRFRNNSIMNGSYMTSKMDCIWVANRIKSDMTTRNIEMIRASACASFRILRIVYGQIPFMTEERALIWKEIKKYRSIVVRDNRAMFYERTMACISFVGPLTFFFSTKAFAIIRAAVISHRGR